MAVRMCLLDIGVHWLESPWSIYLSGAERLGQGPSAAVSPGTGTGRHAEHSQLLLQRDCLFIMAPTSTGTRTCCLSQPSQASRYPWWIFDVLESRDIHCRIELSNQKSIP